MTEQYKYRVGGSLSVDAPTYVTRQADHDFFEGLKTGDFCYVLNARQTGKSSLLWRTRQRLAGEGVRCAVIDLSSIGRYQMTADKWYATVIRKLVNDFDLANEFDQNTWWCDLEHLSPTYRFSEFIETVLLTKLQGPIVIFMDEIDSVLRFEFKDDFFTAIRAFFNKRAENPDYDRLTFALLGVATPSDLIEDKEQTPFNIGRAIELTGFQSHEVEPLTQGFMGKVTNPQATLEEILQWTGGHPFLTQKLCSLLLQELEAANSDSHAVSIAAIVHHQIIDNWEAHDYPEHLKTIRNRMVTNEKRAGRLLGLYRDVLEQQETEAANGTGGALSSPDAQSPGILASNHPDQMALRLTGLVIKQRGRLKVYNRIYASIFDRAWISQELSNLRPYCEAFNAWVASDCKDDSRLLRGAALKEAQEWAVDKNLDPLDVQFLHISQEKGFEAERLANEKATQILTKANQRAKQRIRIGSLFLVGSLLATVGLANVAEDAINQTKDAEIRANDAQSSLKLTKNAVTRLNEKNQQVLASLERAQRSKEMADTQARDAKKRAATARRQVEVAQEQVEVAQARADEARERERRSQTAAVAAQASAQAAHNDAEVANDQRAKAEEAQKKAENARELTEDIAALERRSNALLAIFEKDSRGQLDSLLQAVRSGKDLQAKLRDQADEYPTPSSILALQSILSNIQEVQRFSHREWIWGVSFSPDGSKLAIAGNNRRLYICKLATRCDTEGRPEGRNGKASTIFSNSPNSSRGHNGEILSVQFNPQNNNQVATGSADGTVRLWDTETMESAPLPGNDRGSKVVSVAFSPDGTKVAAARDDGRVSVWNIDSRKITASFQAHPSRIFKLSFAPNGQQIATAGFDGTARIWDIQTERQIAEFKHRGMVLAVSFGPNGKLATAGENGFVYLWDVRSRRKISEFSAHLSWIMSVHFSPDGKQLVTTGLDFAARVWDVDRIRSNTDVAGFRVAEFKHRGLVTDASFRPDGQQLATTSLDQTTRLWKLPARQTAQIIDRKLPEKNTFTTRVLFSPADENLIAVANANGIVQIYNVLSSSEKITINANGWVSSMSFDSHGKRLATAKLNGEAQIWDVTSGQDITKNLLSLKQEGLSQGKPQNRETSGTSSVSFSPDGKHLAIAYLGGIVRLWDIESQRQVSEFKVDRFFIGSMSFSPDGRILATTGAEGKVKLWDVRNQKEINTTELEKLNRRILSVSFHPRPIDENSNVIALAASDGFIQLWSIHFNARQDRFLLSSKSSNLPPAFQAHEGSVLSVIFSSRGSQLATVGLDSAIRVWAVPALKAPDPNKTDTTQYLPQIAEFQAERSLAWNISLNTRGNQIAIVEADAFRLDRPVSSKMQVHKIESLAELLVRACDWLRSYPEAQNTCKDINQSISAR